MATVLDSTVLALKPSLFMIQPAPGTFQLLPLSVWVFFLSPIMGGQDSFYLENPTARLEAD